MHETETAARREPTTQQRNAGTWRPMTATRIVVSGFGAVVAFAGIEHGVGEILQGPVVPAGLTIESWPDAEAFAVLAGEPAMTVIPNLLLTGMLAVIVALGVGIWSIWFVERRHGGLVLIGLSVLLLLVGGGFGPPLLGITIGIGATRIGAASGRPPGPVLRGLGRFWPWILAAGVLGYLGLFPGLVLVSQVLRVPDALVYALSAFAFAALILALIAARARDRVRATG
jgi:hypothetical protein